MLDWDNFTTLYSGVYYNTLTFTMPKRGYIVFHVSTYIASAYATCNGVPIGTSRHTGYSDSYDDWSTLIVNKEDVITFTRTGQTTSCDLIFIPFK